MLYQIYLDYLIKSVLAYRACMHAIAGAMQERSPTTMYIVVPTVGMIIYRA